ncbi:zinc finger BED domain-containing protein 5-like [Nothobranchius furzeri]|uniref:zinc finger BED domain-containing protein 5-like n=1 Tax=Nothobranchius furzeri TaxID=105023 RepID=UPI00390492A9
MKRWLTQIRDNKQKPTDHAAAADSENSGDPPSTSEAGGGAHKLLRKAQLNQPSPKFRRYREEYFQYGFTCTVINEIQYPQCVLCTELLANESFKPAKMLRHLKTKHSSFAAKPADFFRRKERAFQSQKKVMTNQKTISAKAQKASYEVAYLIAQAKKTHTIGEILIKPAAIAMSQIMHGDKQAQELKAVPLSDGTISRRITEMAQDIKSQLIDRVKRGKYALQLDESIDVANSAQLLVFVRYSFDGKLHEDMLFCTTLEVLASKSLDPELKTVLESATKIVNHIKSHPLNTRLFAALCNEMGSEHQSLLFHTEVRWLSRGNVLRRLFELRDEVRLFLLEHGSHLAAHLTDPDWLTMLAYLACIFDKLNGLNTSLQVENANIMSLNDKINAFKRKLDRWSARVKTGCFDMFPELEEFMEENDLCVNTVKGYITMHLQTLLEHFIKFFPEEKAPEKYDWIRSPFTVTSTHHLSSDIEDALVELSSDRTLKSAFNSKMLAEFWISVEREYPQLSKAAIDILMPFGSTYLSLQWEDPLVNEMFHLKWFYPPKI